MMGRHVNSRLVVLFLPGVALASGGCSSDAPTPYEVRQVADTLVSVSREIAPTISAPIEVFFRSERLAFPQWFDRVGDVLYVSDLTTIHAMRISSSGVQHEEIGSPGEGPGEFSSIAGLVGVGDSLLLVLDDRLLRLTYIEVDGVVKNTQVLEAPEGFPGVEPVRLRVIQQGLARGVNKAVVYPGEEGQEYGVVWQLLGRRESDFVARLRANQLTEAEGILVPSNPYGPRALIAIGADGAVAIADGVEYCVSVTFIEKKSTPQRKICRDWQRQKAESDPHPDELGIETSDLVARVHRQRLKYEQIGPSRNSFERMLYDEMGNLWIQQVPKTSPYSTLLRYSFPSTRPDEYVWDVFDSEGHRIAAVLLDSGFEPKHIDTGGIFGRLEMETGEIAIGWSPTPAEISGPGIAEKDNPSTTGQVASQY